MNPLVSIVTPVCNGESHLRECIESVLAQTYAHWEYTIVNNCSTDRTLEIAREYSSRDSRIRVVCNESFVPVIANYNIAFRQISPRSHYCKVIAADDWMFPECIERMVRLAEQHPSVGIVGAFQLRGSEVPVEGLSYPRTVVTGLEVCRAQLLGGPYIFGTPSTVLFRSTLVRRRHAFFNESNIHADDEACLEVLEHHDFGFVHQILVFRRVREGSTSSFSERFHTYSAGLLLLLVKYGPKYLSQEELVRRIKEVLAEYYDLLAKEAFKGREQAFWAYHRARMAELGHPLNRIRLAAAVLAFVVDSALNPKRTAEELLHRWGSRKAGHTPGQASATPMTARVADDQRVPGGSA